MKITLLRKAPTLCGIPNSLGYFAGVGASFTRALHKFTAETIQYFIIYYAHKNNLQYSFLRNPLWSLWFKCISLKENIHLYSFTYQFGLDTSKRQVLSCTLESLYSTESPRYLLRTGWVKPPGCLFVLHLATSN